MNIYKMVQNTRVPLLELDQVGSNRSGVHFHSKSNNLYYQRQNFGDKKPKQGINESKSLSYRISSVRLNPDLEKSQISTNAPLKFEKSLALFCSNRERSLSKNQKLQIDQKKIMRELSNSIIKKSKNGPKPKICLKNEQEDLFKLRTARDDKGIFRSNFEKRFPISHGHRTGWIWQGLDRHSDRQQKIFRLKRNVKSKVVLLEFLPKIALALF
jgi:hypothetical protein